jgi:hypothetical protein
MERSLAAAGLIVQKKGLKAESSLGKAALSFAFSNLKSSGVQPESKVTALSCRLQHTNLPAVLEFEITYPARRALRAG